MKLLRTIRLDASDTFVFDRAAESGEWAVPGTFLFWNADPTALEGKARTAFRAGFLGTRTFGHSTLATVTEVSEAEYEAAVTELANALVARLGAPDVAIATPAAREEIELSRSLCDHAPRTLVAMHRRVEAGEIVEQYRTLQPGKPVSEVRAFSFVALDDAPGAIEDGIDLAGLLEAKR